MVIGCCGLAMCTLLPGTICSAVITHSLRSHLTVTMDARARYAVWLRDTGVMSDFTIMNVEELLDANNPSCGDLGDTEPMLNYLRPAPKPG